MRNDGGDNIKTSELFIDDYHLPGPLPKEEFYRLVKEAKEGSKDAQDKLVIHNIRLVLYEVTSKFRNVNYDMKDLVSLGNLGLMKAINTYDPSKKTAFATYATRCIENEILMFLRKLKKDQNVYSLNETIAQNQDGDEIKLEDHLRDDTDLVADYEGAETHKIVRKIVEELPDFERKIIMLRFGFYDDKIYGQREIADQCGISRSYVSRLVSKIVKKVGRILESKEEVFELPSELKKAQKEYDKNMRKLQTIYQYFKAYTKEQVDEMLAKLGEEEQALVTLRYGEDLEHPISTKLTQEQSYKFYGSLVPKMKRLLEKQTGEKKSRKVRQKEEEIQQPIVEPTEITQNSTPQLVQPEIELITQSSELQTEVPTSPTSEEMSKEDYIMILESLRTPTFSQMMNVLSVKEAVIISLKLGYIDGKYFSTRSIAQFLGIEETEVIETTKKVLLLHKESINTFLDHAIAVATDQRAQDKVLPMEKTNFQKEKKLYNE